MCDTKVKIDWDKPLQNRMGKKARLVCKDVKRGECTDSYLVLVESNTGIEDYYNVSADGHYALNPTSPDTIINVPPTTVDVWAVVEKSSGTLHSVFMGNPVSCSLSNYTIIPAKLTYEYHPQ